MRVAIAFCWYDDLHPDHRQRIVDMCLTIEEAQTSTWLLPIDVGAKDPVGPTLVFDSSRGWEEIATDLERDGYVLSEFHAVSVG